MNEYGYLWTAPVARYVLVRLEGTDAPLIWDKELKSVLVIEDDEVHRQVTDRMAQAGVPFSPILP